MYVLARLDTRVRTPLYHNVLYILTYDPLDETHCRNRHALLTLPITRELV